MEKIDLYRLDGIVLGQSAHSSEIERIVCLTCDLINEENENNIQHALRSCIAIESQLRLREISLQPNMSHSMSAALGQRGLCSVEVILRKLEGLIPFKELHSLILMRA